MKKPHWFRNTLIVLVICGLLGTVLAAIQFSKDADRTSASASIEFSFNGAADGKAPNGYPFDLSGMTSDDVLNDALEASGLTGKYTAEQLRENIIISGVYPAKIVERMTQYVSLLDKEADNQAVVIDYHATEYTITLYNDFDPSVSPEMIKGLVGNILTAYRNHFAKVYGTNLGNASPIADLQEYDYAQQLETIYGSAEQEARYAREMAQMAPGFRMDGMGFGDIAARYDSVKSDIDRLVASVTLNVISKDPERLQAQYESEIRTQKYKLESLNEKLKMIEDQVNTYDKNGIIYVSTGGVLKQIGNDKAGTYDKLVMMHKDVTDQIAAVKAKIALYESKLEDIAGVNGKTDEEGTAVVLTSTEKKAMQESTEKKLEELTVKKNAVSDDFRTMLETYTSQQINENTVSTTSARFYKPSIFSGAFIKYAIKTAGPFCAVGFMACLVLLIRSRRKEEKAKA